MKETQVQSMGRSLEEIKQPPNILAWGNLMDRGAYEVKRPRIVKELAATQLARNEGVK